MARTCIEWFSKSEIEEMKVENKQQRTTDICRKGGQGS